MKKILFLMILFLLFSCENKELVESDNINSDKKIVKQESQEKINTWVVLSNKEEIDENKKIEIEKEIIKIENKYCILDECIPLDVDIKEENWFFIGKINRWWDTGDYKKYTYRLNTNLDFLEIILEEMMHKETIKIFKVWEYYIKSIDNAWCWGSNLDQKVYDKNSNEVKDFLLSEFTKDIKIWNIIYKPTLIWKWWFGQPLDSFNKFKAFKNEKWKYEIFKNEKEFQVFVENKVLNIDKKIYESYITKYEKYPEINVIYNSVWYDDSSIRVVWLWIDKNYLAKNIMNNWEYLDLSVTNKIISYYNWWNEWIFDSNWKRITKVDFSQLPIFNMKKLNDNWNYLVYFQKWYKIQQFVEMCKPVVYYYSNENESNILTLNLKKWDYFTKLIPELNNNSAWEFESNNWKVIVENKEYDYLYYSLVTLWYKHNDNWWIVKWENIINFFNDKLDKINFNKKEKNDFIDFWKHEYEENKYYFVSFKYKEELDKIIPLKFTKNPENEFRVLLDSYVLDNYSEEINGKYLYSKIWNAFDGYLIKKFNRSLNTREVFEWGGVLVKENETIIK